MNRSETLALRVRPRRARSARSIAEVLPAQPETGEYGGFYVWKTLDDVLSYRASDLAASIAATYRGVAAPEVTVYEIVMPLRT